MAHTRAPTDARTPVASDPGVTGRDNAPSDARVVSLLRAAARPLTGSPADLDPLLDLVGDARFVLLGEASHGTHEFYKLRAELTKRLVAEKGFAAVAVEADWPDAYRVNRYVRGAPATPGAPADADPNAALGGFRRFPQWMWRNADVLGFVRWLRAHNDARPAGVPKAGFYGLDLYSLHGSIDAVLRYLDKVDPAAARRARSRYGCFEDFGEDPQAYGYAASFDLERSCHDAVVQQLVELQRKAADYANRDGRVAEDEYFYTEQNARLVSNAERYYRAMFERRTSSWNLRDTHMAETLDALAAHLTRTGRSPGGGPAKVVVWAHNSHLGDARATEMGADGELNLGQLVRQTHGAAAINVGFSTYAGTVSAAHDWGGPAERMAVRPGLPGSYETLFHEAVAGGDETAADDADDDTPAAALWLLRDAGEPLRSALSGPRLQRAIGVIYRPRTERASHYFHARLAAQFDAMIHVDRTRAVEPLERDPEPSAEADAETFPSGL
jgi:erythromycin esterase-like protein